MKKQKAVLIIEQEEIKEILIKCNICTTFEGNKVYINAFKSSVL